MFRPFICISFLASLVLAQDVVQLDKIEIQDRISEVEDRKDDSIAKRIIKGEELAQYGDMNAMEILLRTPGVTLSEGKGKKSAPGKGYTKVLIDGEEIQINRRNNPLEQISPDMIERVEVMTNGSAEYTAEAMGGIVNIVLKRPKSEGMTKAKLTGGWYHADPMGTVFAQQEGKRDALSYMINAAVSDDRRNDTASSVSDSRDENERIDSHARMATLTSKLIYVSDPYTKYFFDATLSRSSRDSDSVQTGTDTILKKSETDSSMIWAKLSGTHNLASSGLLEWKLKFHQNDSQGNTDTLKGSESWSEEDENLFRTFGVQGNYSFALEEHFIKTGIDLRHSNEKDKTVLDTTSVSTQTERLNENKGAVFVQDEWSVNDNLIVTPGLRYETSQQQFGDSSRFDYFAPSLHLLYRLSPNDNLRSSVARTVKLPRLSELSPTIDSTLQDNDINHPDVTGNPNLKEEKALSYEVRYEHFFDDKGIASIGGFYRTINDKIEKLTTIEDGRYVERPYNSGTGKLWSVEIEFKKSLNAYVEGLGIFGNATFQNTSLETNGFKRSIKQTPDYLYNIGIDQTLKPYKITFGAAYRYVGGYDDPMDENGVAESQKGHGTLDLYMTKRLNQTFKAGLNLKNITAETIKTTTRRYESGVLEETQTDRENSRFNFLITLEGRW